MLASRMVGSLTMVGLLAVRGLAAQAPTPALAPSPEAPSVLRQVHAYDAAWARRDTTMMRMLLTPAYQYTSPGTGTASRAATLSYLTMPGYHPSIATRDSVSVHVHDTTATVQSILHTSGSMNGHAFTEAQRCELDLVAPKGVWLIASEKCEKVAAPTPPAKAGRKGRGN